MQRRLTSSGSFTIATVEDGVSQPSYIRTQEAWSNDATTANAATSPTISGNWSDSTPVKTATYLWRRSCLMTLNEATRTYNSGTWSYQRLSGENGTSIHTVGQVTNASSRGSGTATIITDGGTQTISLVDGDAVTQLDDGHLYQWVTEGGGKWLDLGVFKGESGVTYFTHIAWATETADPTQEHPAPSPAQGQTTRPNKYSVTGGSIAPFDGAVWMGILVNTSLSDSTDFNLYTWNEVKGSPSIFVTLSNDNDTMLYSSGSNIPISGNVVSTATLYDGAEPKTSAADGVTWSIAPSVGVTAVIANNVVTISAMATTSGTVTVKATYKGNIYSKQITLKKLVDKDKYDVIVTPNSVAYNSTTDTPETTSITLKCYKTIVTGERADATPPSGYYLALFGKKANGTVIRIGYTNAFKTLTTTCDNSLYEECIAAICNNTVFDNITEFLDYQTIPITKAENGNKGEDAFRCSIDNQHEDFLYNDDGTLISPSGGATSQAMLYQGEQNITPMANWLISSDGGSTWASSVTGTVTASIVTSGTNIGKLTVLGFSGASAKVLVRAEYPSTNGTFYYAEFTANKTSQDKYDLIISPNSIAYNPATYVTQQVSVSAKRTDFQGNTTSVPISLQENVGKLRLFTAVVLQDGKHTQLSQIDELPLFVNEIIADNFVGMYIELRKYVNPNGSNASSNVVVDYQTIPITKAENGNKGEDAVVYKISLAGSVFSVDPNQSGGLLHFNINGTVYKTVGGTTSIYTELTEHLLTLSTISSDGQETTLSTGDYSVSNGEFTSTVYEGTGYDDESIFLAVLTIGNREVARESIQIERYGENGQTGQRGKVGRFFYFGGTFDSNNNSLRYTVNDAQAPYFEHTENGQKRYHVFNYETNGSYTMSQMWAISSNWNNKPWESMTNDFKYIITEATFSQFAHLGSFIISGDYFISQYGTLLYNNSGNIEEITVNATNVSALYDGRVPYAWFDDTDPMAETNPSLGSYKFRPTKCMDALSGDEWMAGGNIAVKGNGDVDIIGTIRAKNLYHNVCLIPAAGEYSNDVYYVYDNSPKIDDFWEEHPEYHIGDYITIPHNTTLPNGIHPCTYNADVVVMIPNNINWEWPSNGNICYLPKPSDFVGKIVEVNMQGSCGENGKIMCVDSSQAYFIHSPRFDGQTIVDADTYGPYAFSTVYLRFSVQAYQIPAGGGTYQSIGWREVGGKRVLYSDGSHWITIE